MALAGQAEAAPQPGTAWKKVAAAYMTQGRAHGVKVTCDPYNRVISPRCRFGEDSQAGFVLGSYRKGDCAEFSLTYLSPTFGGNRRSTVELCRPRWWLQLAAVPGPWSPSRREEDRGLCRRVLKCWPAKGRMGSRPTSPITSAGR